MNDVKDVARIVEQEADLSRRGLLSKLVEQFDGLDGVAMRAKLLYDNSADTPNVQAKLLDMVISGITELDQETTQQVEEEDLMAVFRELLTRPEIRLIAQQVLNETNGTT